MNTTTVGSETRSENVKNVVDVTREESGVDQVPAKKR